jgi:Undecaprenyl-phosphate glucose phosphotransferase
MISPSKATPSASATPHDAGHAAAKTLETPAVRDALVRDAQVRDASVQNAGVRDAAPREAVLNTVAQNASAPGAAARAAAVQGTPLQNAAPQSAVPQSAARPQPVPARRGSRVRAALDAGVWLSDILALTLAFVLGYLARGILPFFSIPPNPPPFERFLPTMIMHVVVIITLFFVSRMYHQRRSMSRIDQARNVLGAVTIGAFLVNGIQEFVFKNTFSVDYPRSMFFYVWSASIVLVIVGRELNRALRRWMRVQGIERDPLVIVGVGRVARDVARRVMGNPSLGYSIVGMVAPGPVSAAHGRPRALAITGTHARTGNRRPPAPRNATARRRSVQGLDLLGTTADLPRLIDQYGVQHVIIAVPDAEREELAEWVALCQRGRVDIKLYPDTFAFIARELNVDDLDGMALLSVRDVALRGWNLTLKRMMDVTGALIGLIMLSPLLLVTAALIRLESPGDVFYTQERMGLDGRPFHMLKFRSMRADAEKTGAGWTVKDDPRVTRIGRFMRRTSWDELPQLINVLVGDMSLVGPRPERPVYVEQFRQRIPHYMDRHREKAGMTGWAQVNGLRGDTSIEERTAYDLWYVEHWSVWLDLKIILRTVLNIVLRRDKNAY